MTIATINPTTGEVVKTFTPLTEAEIQSSVERAATTFASYRHTSLSERSQWLHRVAQLLREHQEHYARLITLEVGKTLAAARAEVEKSAWVCEYYAKAGPELLADVEIATTADRSFIRYAPVGVLLAVMPWNFPFWQVFRFAAPALIAGNTALLKHAANVPQSALAIQEIIAAAGFPSGVFQTLLISGSQVAGVIRDPRVKAASLTGSEGAGISVATAAAAVIKPVVLELGGSDPFIILASADWQQAIATAVTARMISNGQSCIAAKRFIVVAEHYDPVEQGMKARFEALVMGDPFLPATDLGPLATPTIRDELHDQVQRAVAAGARLVTGGYRPEGAGNFYPPTILADLDPHHPLAQEEFFGPVALLFRVKDLEEAIQVANHTPFGLGASAWTRDPAEQQRLITEIESGSVFINDMTKSDPRLPFGGTKRSGYGRELGSHGLYALVNIKTIVIQS